MLSIQKHRNKCPRSPCRLARSPVYILSLSFSHYSLITHTNYTITHAFTLILFHSHSFIFHPLRSFYTSYLLFSFTLSFSLSLSHSSRRGLIHYYLKLKYIFSSLLDFGVARWSSWWPLRRALLEQTKVKVLYTYLNFFPLWDHPSRLYTLHFLFFF